MGGSTKLAAIDDVDGCLRHWVLHTFTITMKLISKYYLANENRTHGLLSQGSHYSPIMLFTPASMVDLLLCKFSLVANFHLISV